MHKLKNCKVLLVDDSSTTRVLVGELLRPNTDDFLAVSTAKECREALADQVYDLVLLDYRLPDGDGLSLLKEIRKQRDDIALVVITGKSDLHTPTDAMSEGADGFLDKAYIREGPGALCAALGTALANRRTVQREEELRNLKDEIHTLLLHDLRNPAACASMALQSFRRSSNEEALNLATRALDRLFVRLDKYLDFIGLEDGNLALHKDEYCFRGLVTEVAEGLTPVAEEKNLQFLLHCTLDECPARFDWNLMYRAVENILDNAVKYSASGYPIEITISKGEQCVLEVQDRGPGIDPQDQARVFQRFFRSSKTSEQVRGTGLGLLIVRRVLEAHQGSVGVSSDGESGSGSRFRLSFPLS